MPRNPNKEVDSRKFEGQVRQTLDAVEGVEGVATLEVEPLEIVEGPRAMDMATALMHAEDKLTILIHQSGDKFQEDPVQVGVNGRMGYIKRGQKTIVKRKYVERLLRAQSDSVEQDITATDERNFNRLTIRPSQRYPLSVLYDPDPNGAAWLQQITEGS